MGNGYRVPAEDAFDELRQILTTARDRLRELERPTGTQLTETVKTLQQLVQGILEQTEVNVTGNVTAGGNVVAGGDISLVGDIYTPSGRATPVVTSYVAAYLNSDGRLGATPSGSQFKQDVAPRAYTMDEIALIEIVTYRLIAAVAELGDDAQYEVGVIAQQLLAAGFPEFVIMDGEGQPFTVTYERMVVACISCLQETRERILAIEQRLNSAGL